MNTISRLGIVKMYCGESGTKGFYNSQEIGAARALQKSGYSIYIFYPRKDIDQLQEEIIQESITLVYVPAKAVGNHARFDWNIFKAYKIDVLQIAADNQMYAPSLISFCDRNNIRLYCYIGTIKSDSDNPVKNMIMSHLVKKNIRAYRKHMCFAKTKKAADELSKLGIPNVSVAPVGLDTSIIPTINEDKFNIRKRLLLPADKRILLFVGRLESYKRPEKALELMQALSDSYYLVMIGKGSLDENIDEIIENKGIKAKVKRIEQLPNRDIHEYYKAADYFLNFNENEIFGMSILEAMYQDCTVIAVKAPGPVEIIESGVNGYLVNDVSQMKTLIEKESRVSEGAARECVKSQFTWEKTASKFLEYIQEKSPKNILLVHNRYKQKGGEDTVFENEKRLLEDHGHNVFTYERSNEEIDDLSLFRKLLLPLSSIYSFRTKREIKRLIEDKNINLVHVHNTLTMISPSVFSAVKAMKIPVVMTLHNYRMLCPNGLFFRDNKICEECFDCMNGKSHLLNAVRHKCYRGSLAQSIIASLILKINRMLGTYRGVDFIALTEFGRDKISRLKYIDSERMHIKPNFVPYIEKSEKKPASSINDGRKRLIYAGRLEVEKGAKDLVSEYAATGAYMGEKFDELVLCGTGSLLSYCQDAAKTDNRIKCLGLVPHDEMLQLVEESTAMAFPSRCYEGLGLTILEAYSVGTRVIGPGLGAAGSILKKAVFDDMQNGPDSIYYPEGNYRLLLNIYEKAGNCCK